MRKSGADTKDKQLKWLRQVEKVRVRIRVSRVRVRVRVRVS